MPIYEYKCENGHVFDVMQKLSEDPLSSCVECGAPVRKVLHVHQRRQRVSLGSEEEQREATRVLHQLREKGLNPWRVAPACHRSETARKVYSEGHSVRWC